MLGVLRGSDDDAGHAGPAPGLGDLDALVADVVQVRRDGRGPGAKATVADVPAGVDLAAYRIVQEALTNVIKHAGRVRATVVVRYTGDAVAVEVDDDGGIADARRTRVRSATGRSGRHARAGCAVRR